MPQNTDHQFRPFKPVPGAQPAAPQDSSLSASLDRWAVEQMFEEDVRAVLRMMRPHGRERLEGWKEYRTGGAHFRVTVSWDPDFENSDPQPDLAVPHMDDVIEALLIGSIKNEDLIELDEEFTRYRDVLCQVYERLHERQSCHE